MGRWIVVLSLFLFLQLVLAVGLNLGRTDYGAFKARENLISFEVGKIDGLDIQGDDDKHLGLKKQDGQWRISDLSDFPADQGDVERLLEKLAGLKKGWPVATTRGAAERFKVAEGAFERKITLSRGEETVDTVYVGTSPGLRKVHVRIPDEASIYAVEFSAFEASVKPDDWIDTAILSHKASEIVRAELPGFVLERQGEKLLVADMEKEKEEVVEDEAKRLINNIADLPIRSVLGTEPNPEYNQDDPELSYTLALQSGESETYVFSKPKEGDDYILKASPRDEYFKVNTWAVDRIKEVTREDLVRAKAHEEADSQDTES